MKNVNIYLPDGNFSGAVSIWSTMSSFTMIRVKREHINIYSKELARQGVYMLLMGTDYIYVGQTSHDVILKRINDTHSLDIDTTWHTLVAFPFVGAAISNDELLYLENAMCEYIYMHYHKCATTTPSMSNCNIEYRNSHYGLTIASKISCMTYLKDMESYIGLLGDTLFIPSEHPDIGQFYLVNSHRDAYGTAEIPIHQGHSGKRKTTVKAGSKVSDGILKYSGSEKIIALRKMLEAEGKLVDRIMQVDYTFDSQSAAGSFVNGGSFDGNQWKRISDGKPLKELL